MTINDVICKLYNKANNAAMLTFPSNTSKTLFDADVAKIEIKGDEVEVYFKFDGV